MRNIHLLFKTIITALFISALQPLCAQVTETVEDSITISEHLEGIITYDQYERQGEVIKHKNYLITADKLDRQDTNYFNKLVLEGTYHKNDRDKNWEYSFKRLTPSKSAKIDGYKVVQLGDGNEYVIKAKFDKGNANGDWEVFKRLISNSEIDTTTFKAKTAFKENTFLGTFESVCDSIEINGRIDELGFFDGEWIFHQKKDAKKTVSEHRIYEEGVLVEHRIQIDGNTFKVKHVGLDKTIGGEDEIWEEVNVSEDYFNIIFKTNFGVESDALSLEETNDLIGKSNAFLKYSIFSFGKHDDVNIWKIDDGKDIVYPKLKVRKFPYTDEEKEQIEGGLKLIKESTEIIEDYLNDPQVDINRYNYKEISLYYEIYKVYNRELKKLKNVFEKLNLYTYEYVNRDKILPYLLKDGIQYPDEITYEYDDQKLSEAYEFPEGISSDNRSIKKMNLHLEAINNSLIETKKQVEPIIEKNRKRAEIAEKESELVKKRDSIIDLFNDKENREDYNTYHESFKEDVNAFIMDRFKTYANKDVEERLDKTQFVIDCFKTIGTLYSKLVDLEEKKERIEESYKREVWSPVTYTYMTETIKERIYNAYKNYLLDKVVDDIKKSIGCEKLDEKMENISILYKEMMAIRDRDTSKEERALRRVKDADKILSILNIKLN